MLAWQAQEPLLREGRVLPWMVPARNPFPPHLCLRLEEKEATETLLIMWKTPIGRLRAVGLLEGTSFLVLLFIALPLKYFGGMPLAVKLVGWAHGLLFMLYLLALGHTASSRQWSLLRVGAGFLASVVPFGPFVFDVWLRREELLPAEERQ